MVNTQIMSKLELSKTDPSRISKSTFEGAGQVTFFKKSNFFVDIEDNKAEVQKTDSNKIVPLSKMEMMIIQTAFFMAHELNVSAGSKSYDAETEFIISLKTFKELWQLQGEENMSDGSFYTTVKRAITKLDQRRFFYKPLDKEDDARVTVLSGYFSSIKFIIRKNSSSEFSFSFPKDFIPYLKSYGQFTWYYFENTIKLRDYPMAAVLYEQLSKYKNSRSNRKSQNEVYIEFEIAKIRRMLNIGDGYNTNDLIRKIITPSSEIINKESSINITNIEKIKDDGKNISSIRFLVEFDDVDLNFRDAMKTVNEGRRLLTDAQILKYAFAIAVDVVFSHEYKKEGENDFEFAARISEELKDNEKVMEYYPFLQKIGFISKNLEKRLLLESTDEIKF